MTTNILWFRLTVFKSRVIFKMKHDGFGSRQLATLDFFLLQTCGRTVVNWSNWFPHVDGLVSFDKANGTKCKFSPFVSPQLSQLEWFARVRSAFLLLYGQQNLRLMFTPIRKYTTTSCSPVLHIPRAMRILVRRRTERWVSSGIP